MGSDRRWKRFEKSGKVEDYLEYACTIDTPGAESQLDYVSNSTIGIDDMEDITTISDIYDMDIAQDRVYDASWDDRIELY